ncbi:MAG: hypothetical protein Kow00127_00720 [Bacteroidales bacterium]
MTGIHRIAITGPESTGKTWLAEQLARHYNTRWIAEYSREFLMKSQGKYSYDDILIIAREQDRRNRTTPEGSQKFIFCDTELLVTYVWCQYKYGKCHPWITEQLPHQPFSLYLLPDTELPWSYDPLRENPHEREELLSIYRNELDRLNLPWEWVRGEGQQRLQSAVAAIEKYFG